jgi:hypothetical protein
MRTYRDVDLVSLKADLGEVKTLFLARRDNYLRIGAGDRKIRADGRYARFTLLERLATRLFPRSAIMSP